MSSGTTAQDGAWKERQRSEEAHHAHAKEQEQLATIRKQLDAVDAATSDKRMDKDFEGGFGGQEDFEDRYATTSGEH